MKQLKKTLLTLVALLAVTTQAWAADYYVVGNFNDWSTNPAYKMTLNTECTSTTEYILTLDLAADAQFKVVKDDGQGQTWYPDGMGNNYGENGELKGAGKYTVYFRPNGDGNQDWFYGVMNVAAAESATAVDIDWNAASNTGSFTMPGGNVTLEPEYYPQATVADGGVTAADADARATTDDPLVKVDATKLTGAKKLMYFVSNSGTTAPAYDAEGWTDQLPTAEGFTQQGIVYVWYYPVGTDEGVDGATATYSDGDICLQSITARIAAAPTYAVTFADDTAEPTLWTASPNTGVKKGQQVTVTYTGSKKVIGVKVEKKAAAPAGPITVTWNPSDIVPENPGDHSFTKDGITITAATCDFQALTFAGGGTFTTTLGNFTKIEISADFTGNVSGTGWSNDGWQSATWTGNAASVSFSGAICGGGMTCEGGNLTIVFTID